MHPVAALIAIGVCSILLTYGTLRLELLPMDILLYLAKRSHNTVLWLNYLPILLLMLFIYLVTAHAFFSISLVSFLLLLMSFTNRIKIQLRGDPFMHHDFPLFQEAMKVAFGFGIWNVIIGIIAVIAFLGIVACLCWKFNTTQMGWKTRVLSGLLMLSFLYFCNEGLYSNQSLYDSFPVYGDYYNMADVFESRGFIYSFLYHFNTRGSVDTLPKDEKLVMQAIADHERRSNDECIGEYKPNIIMIMGESFSGLSESEAIDFEGYQNPLETFTQMGAAGIAGKLVVPSRGGGTADTEFDVLTGMAARYLRGVPYAYRLLVRPTESLPSLLRQIGYDTLALHPGYRWFYNRQNVYPTLGFERAVFEDEFARDAYLDLYIGEEATFDMLLEQLESHKRDHPDHPLFTFCVTIQNHAAYENRFLPKGSVTFTPTIPMTEQEQNILSNYFSGITDADMQLARLQAYANEQQTPYVIVYFGDHLPALERSLYGRLLQRTDSAKGSLAKETALYTVPFIIWQNDAAEALWPLSARENSVRLPDHKTISSNFLGSYIIELLGFDGISSFFDFTSSVRKVYPILLENQHFIYNSTEAFDTTNTPQDLLYLYKAWIRHQIL